MGETKGTQCPYKESYSAYDCKFSLAKQSQKSQD